MSEWKAFLQEEDAIGVVEIILILVVLVGLVVIFKKQLTSLGVSYTHLDVYKRQNQ